MPWLRVEESAPSTLGEGEPPRRVLSLGPRQSVRLVYTLVGRRRGVYEVGPARVGSGDLFGFAEFSGQAAQADRLVVYPRVIPLTHVALGSHAPLGTIASRQPLYADPSRFAGVRGYRPGDPLRAISWKSSAHAGELQVRKLEPAVLLTTLLALDLSAGAYSRQLRGSSSEWAIVVAASLASYLAGERQAVGLAINGLDSLTGEVGWTAEPRPGRRQLMRILEQLARAQLADGSALAGWLPGATAGLGWGATVVAVSPSGDETLLAALGRLRRAGLNPVLVVVEPYGQFGVVRERARRLGVAAHEVSDEDDLRAWQRRPGERRAA
jgi:uncharacterized protein (DUF58 family)